MSQGINSLGSPLHILHAPRSHDILGAKDIDKIAQIPPLPKGIFGEINQTGRNTYEAPIYIKNERQLVSNADFRIVRIGGERAVRIDHLESFAEGKGYGTFNLGVVAKWAEENGFSRVVVNAGSQVIDWYSRPPRSFTRVDGVTNDGSLFNMEVRVPGPLTSWIRKSYRRRS